MLRIQRLVLILFFVISCTAGCGGTADFHASGSRALEGWTCSPLASGPIGGCPDCVQVCAKLASINQLRLGISVETAQSGWLCTATATVKQGGNVLFTGDLDLSAVDLDTLGFTEAGTETVDAQGTGITVEGDGEASTSCQ